MVFASRSCPIKYYLIFLEPEIVLRDSLEFFWIFLQCMFFQKEPTITKVLDGSISMLWNFK